MKAWLINQHGELDALQEADLPAPIPANGQVLVKVEAVSLNHLDLWVRKGVPGHRFPLPLIPGCDIAGTLESGQRVLVNPLLSCGRCGPCRGGFEAACADFGLLGETTDGGCAEYVAVSSENIVPLPENVSFEEAACLPIAYVTAWSMLTRKADFRAGQLALIQSGGSGVSIASIQMAKLLGGTVITTVGSLDKEAKARALGADHVIRYREQNFREEMKRILLQLGRHGVDVAIDHVGVSTFQDSLRSLDRGGKLVTCGATSGSQIQIDLKPVFFKNLSIHGSTMGGRADLPHVLSLLEQRKIKAVIDSRFPMSRLRDAHARLESREGFGKVILYP